MAIAFWKDHFKQAENLFVGDEHRDGRHWICSIEQLPAWMLKNGVLRAVQYDQVSWVTTTIRQAVAVYWSHGGKVARVTEEAVTALKPGDEVFHVCPGISIEIKKAVLVSKCSSFGPKLHMVFQHAGPWARPSFELPWYEVLPVKLLESAGAAC